MIINLSIKYSIMLKNFMHKITAIAYSKHRKPFSNFNLPTSLESQFICMKIINFSKQKKDVPIKSDNECQLIIPFGCALKKTFTSQTNLKHFNQCPKIYRQLNLLFLNHILIYNKNNKGQIIKKNNFQSTKKPLTIANCVIKSCMGLV